MTNSRTERTAVAIAKGPVMDRRSFLPWLVASSGGLLLLAEAYRRGYLSETVPQVNPKTDVQPEDDSMVLRSARPDDKIIITTDQQLSAPAVEALNTNIRTAVTGVVDTASGLTSEMILKADSSLMLSASRVAPEVQTVSNYIPIVNSLVAAVYQPDKFYEADGATVKQDITRLAATLAQHPNETVRQQAADLADWYLNKIASTVYLEQDLLLACRMGDLAIRLNPELTDRVTAEVRRAVLTQEALNQAAEAIKAEEAVMARAKALERTGANTQAIEATRANTIVRVDERIFDGVQTVGDVTVPFTLLPFVLPRIGISPQVLAAQLSALSNTFRGLPVEAKRWRITQATPLIDMLKQIDLPADAGTQIATWAGPIKNLVNVVKLEQADCRVNPCQAWAIVCGGLLETGQEWDIESQGYKFLVKLAKSSGR